MQTLVQVGSLSIGESFEIPSLSETMKNLVVLRKSPGAAYIEGQIKNSITDSFSLKKDYISLSVMVAPSNKPLINISRNNEGVLSTSQTEGKRARGRKSANLEFPKGKFTIAKVAEANKVSTTCVYLKVIEKMKAKEIVIVGSERKEGQRGKPTTIYQLSA